MSASSGICVCPAGRYLNGTTCGWCNADCATCYGPNHSDCITCNETFTEADLTLPTGVGFCTCKGGYEFNEQFDLCVPTCTDSGTYFVDYNPNNREAFCMDCPQTLTCESCARNADYNV